MAWSKGRIAFQVGSGIEKLRALAHSLADLVSYDDIDQVGNRSAARLRNDGLAVVQPFRFLGDRLFLICCLVYAANRFVGKPLINSVFITGYFNDLLLIPCALPVALAAQKLLRIRSNRKPPSIAEVLLHLAVWSFVCEWLGPKWFTNSRGDPCDVVAYAVGAIGAWVWWNRAGVLKNLKRARGL